MACNRLDAAVFVVFAFAVVVVVATAVINHNLLLFEKTTKILLFLCSW